MKTFLDHARGFLTKAANDLTATQAILGTQHATDAACFHAQQAVEKSLKAIMAVHDVRYPWRHDLAELLEQALPFEPQLQSLSESIHTLTPYAVEVRYDVEFEPTLEQADEAFKVARQVYQVAHDHVELVASKVEPPSE